ncbi:MAG: class I SAM-dependent DNA methyltransferase [Streptosporangiales bacterium]
MTSTVSPLLLRERLYEAYASQHAGQSEGAATARIYRRDLRPLLPAPEAGPVLDIGCGQGHLVRAMAADGYDATGMDVSPEQVTIARAAGISQVAEGDYRKVLAKADGHYAAITATDVLEHLTKSEVLDTFDLVHEALSPGGVFIARVPNAVSPFGGYIRYGDFTHETWFTARSIQQLAAAASFTQVYVSACPPVAHGVASVARMLLWKVTSGVCKAALAAETGVVRGHIVTQNLTFAAVKATR